MAIQTYPSSALEVSNVANPCDGTGQVSCEVQTVDLLSLADVERYSQKRTHVLSNGEEIWDLAGNVAEWTSSTVTDQGANGYISTNPANDKSKWGPTYDYSSEGVYPKKEEEFGGLGYGNLGVSGTSVHRGGAWGMGTYSGVFDAILLNAPNDSADSIGFRCAREVD